MAHILVVDDDEQIRDFLEIVLTLDKHKVTLAKDGVEGLRLYRSRKPDLVITDIIMPEKDGIEIIIDIMNSKNPAPIIAMSGGRRKLTSEFTLSSAEILGVKHTLAKPFTEIDLREAITKVLG